MKFSIKQSVVRGGDEKVFFFQHRDRRRQGWLRRRNVGERAARSSSLCMRVGGYTLLLKHAKVR